MSGVLHGVIASLKAAAAAATDSFFNYVTLLLNTTSTNGAQNNTFLDSSTNNFTITRNGDTTQGSFTPYMPNGYWGAFFDGTGDYLTAPNNAAFDFGSGDFTIEAWVYPTASPAADPFIWGKRTASGNYAPILVGLKKNGTNFNIAFWGSLNGSTWGINGAFAGGTITISQNTWTHIAVVRSGTTITGYVNGVADLTVTSISGALMTNTSATAVGASDTSGSNPFQGYLSNVRALKGTAQYTANFTPPTAPLTNITNTSLLTCQSNRFIDNSSNAFAITRNGDTRISKFSPFNPTAAWSAATYGGSGYFDGSGDYLTLGGQTEFAFGTGNFTIEFWVYFQNSSTQVLLYDSRSGSVTNATPVIYRTTGNVIAFFVNGSNVITGTTAISANVWNHIAVARSGTNTKLFINGTQDGSTYTDSNNYIVNSNRPMIGADGNASPTSFLNGYLSNLRVVKGTAVYTSNFTPPTSPLTAISGTSLLCNFTNAGIYDASTINNAQTVGDAQVSTTVAKFGTTSMYFDGTGDYLSVPDNAAFDLGGGDFTIEAFVYLPSLPASNARYNIFGKWGPNPGANDLSYIGQLFNDAGTMKITFDWSTTGTTTTAVSITASVVAAAWLHIAWVRSGTSLKIFLNGTEVTSGNTITGTLWNSSRPLNIGRNEAGNSNLLNGYIDELRITNGYARYTANFTPPTAAFPTS